MSPRAPDGKAQPSISSFFKRKSPPVSPRKGGNDPVIDLTGSPPPPSFKKPRIDSATASNKNESVKQSSSSYFNKPAAKPTSSQSNFTSSSKPVSRPQSTTPARSSTSLEQFRLPKTTQAAASQPGAAFDTYSLDCEAGPSSQSQRIRTAEQEERHEKWLARLQAPGGLIKRRRSLALDEAAAAEARREAGLDTPDPDGDDEGGLATPNFEQVDEMEELARQKAESIGSKLAAKFTAKGAPKGKGKAKKKEEVGPSGQTYTPLEKQFMEIKANNQDVLLLMEVGYKFKFHGEDAKTASKELGIVAFPSRNFYTASIPTHRLHVHVKKLISLGYKVGVITQTETAALKKIGENRNAPFTRELTNLFTAATYVEDPSLPSSSTMLDEPVLRSAAPPPTNALLAVVEQGMGGLAYDERVRIALVSVIPGTGEVVWDEFEDSPVRSELETRLTHLQPAELLLPKSGLSKGTEKILNYFAGATGSSTRVRIEKIDKVPEYDEAFDYLTEFYGQKRKNTSAKRKGKATNGDHVDLTALSDDEMEIDNAPGAADGHDDLQLSEKDVDPMDLAAGLASDEAVLALVDFPKQIVIALSIAIRYMRTFKLENVFRHRASFAKFINRAHMLLSSNTLVNLEIYRNQTDGGIYGSLLWLLDHCKTRMGKRLIREWIGRPLLDVAALRARTDAIEEIMANESYLIGKLQSLLVHMPDIVRGLTRVQYGKATPSELLTILIALERIGSEFKPNQGQGDLLKSPLLNSIVKLLPTILEPAQEFLKALNRKAANENDQASLWLDEEKYPDVQDAKDCISICDSELDQHLKELRKAVKRPTLAYVTVSGIEYLIEIPVRDAKSVPPKWVKISSTKSVNRYHTPEALRIMKEREQHKETLASVSRKAFLDFQSDISECHELVVVSKQIAVIDCLDSLAQVAAAQGYCKPAFVAEPQLRISQGRHAMVEMLRDEAYVPFDIEFSERTGKAKVITGPNMAGKSSCVRAVALIVCMAQIGSFVPASSVTLGLHDAVQTRMGASDEIGRGKSTFMVELSETSDILRTVTPRTLVILDELGRGTSTYDGVAIAYATLSHLAGVGCNTLFVTHYPMVAEELAKEKPKDISNWHMSFDEKKLPDGSAEITFLYKLSAGLAEASFGVWCARLAGLPKSVLTVAQNRADQMKVDTEKRLADVLMKRTRKMIRDLSLGPEGQLKDQEIEVSDVLRNVRVLHKAVSLRSKS